MGGCLKYMNKKIIIFTGLAVLVLFLVWGFLSAMDSTEETSIDTTPIIADDSLILFYGEGCPHCKVVEEYIDSNPQIKQLPIIQKEVYNNINNLEEFEDKIKECQPQPRMSGVPLLWHNRTCLLGDQDIINYLNGQITDIN